MKRLLLLCIILAFYHSGLFAQVKTLTVIPQPREIEYSQSKFLLNGSFSINLFCKNYEPVTIAAEELRNEIKKYFPAIDIVKSGAEKEIQIGIPSENNNFKSICKKNDHMPDAKLGEEGYKLKITTDKIIISANDQRGLFYGIQTLKQLLRGARSGSSLQGLNINDWPDFKYRGTMDDISRGPIPTLDFMKYQIRRLSEMKVNTLMQYVEHVVKTKSHPEFAPVDGSLTIEEWKEISDYALRYNITVVGGFQSFGHFDNVLRAPEYAHLGESGTLISPLLPESYKFLEDIYVEMIPAFHSKIFSVHSDETFDLGKGASKKLVDSLGYAEVFYQHIKKLYDIVKKNNVRMNMWGDIPLEHPEILQKLPKDILIGTWNYDNLESFDHFIEPIKNAGFEFWVVPGVLNSNKLFPNFYQAFGNINNFVRDGKKHGASGVLNCVWDDGGAALFSNDWLGVAYGADKSWNSVSNDSTFGFRFSRGIYASSNENYFKSVLKLNELAPLESTDGMTDKVLFAKMVPDPGKELRISLIDWDEALAILSESEKLLAASDLNNYAGDIEYLQFIIDLYRSLAVERFSLIKASDEYSIALSKINEEPFESRKLILSALGRIEELIGNTGRIKSAFEKLWLMENHTYALDRVSAKYQNKIESYAGIKNSLFKSLKNFDSGLPLLSKKESGLAISKLPGKYFREWMMINPVSNMDNSRLSKVDYLAEMGGELNAVPKVAEEFYFGGEKYRWRRIVSEDPDVLNLAEIFPLKNSSAVTYAFAYVDVKNDVEVKAYAGCDDGIEVIVNTRKIFEATNDNGFKEDEFQFSIKLKKGRNNLMLKISQTGGDWKFTFRLPDSEVRNSKNRYRIISDDTL